jgi:prepilin-type N-terminal cleavage/methylation domain-containing protein
MIRRKAFTLIELLVVIAILAVLMGLLLSAVQRVRSAAARIQCASRLKQVALAMHLYQDTHGRLPPGISRATRPVREYLGWPARVSPYLEREDLWRQTEADYTRQPSPFGNPSHPPHENLARVVPLWTCPADDRLGVPQRDPIHPFDVAFTSYLGVHGVNQNSKDGVLYVDSAVRLLDISDGTSNTLMLGERPPSPYFILGWWYAGTGQNTSGSAEMLLGSNEILQSTRLFQDCPAGAYRFGPGTLRDNCTTLHFWSMHPGGAHFALTDGSVRFITYDAADIVTQMATRAGGEIVTLPQP